MSDNAILPLGSPSAVGIPFDHPSSPLEASKILHPNKSSTDHYMQPSRSVSRQISSSATSSSGTSSGSSDIYNYDDEFNEAPPESDYYDSDLEEE